MTSSNLVGCSTGSSAGLAPLRILSTNYNEALPPDRLRDGLRLMAVKPDGLPIDAEHSRSIGMQ
jgi:hypothetical protein